MNVAIALLQAPKVAVPPIAVDLAKTTSYDRRLSGSPVTHVLSTPSWS